MISLNNYRPKMKNQNLFILRQNDKNSNQKNAGYENSPQKQTQNNKNVHQISMNCDNTKSIFKGRCKKLRLIDQEQEIIKLLKQDDQKNDNQTEFDPSFDDIEKLESPVQNKRSAAKNQIYQEFSTVPSSGQNIQKKSNVKVSKKYNLIDDIDNSKIKDLKLSLQGTFVNQYVDTLSNQNKPDTNFSVIRSSNNQSDYQRLRISSNTSQFDYNENGNQKMRESLNKSLRVSKNDLSYIKENQYSSGIGRTQNIKYNYQKKPLLERNSSNSLGKVDKKNNYIKLSGDQNQYLFYKFPHLALQSNQLKEESSLNTTPKINNSNIEIINVNTQIKNELNNKQDKTTNNNLDEIFDQKGKEQQIKSDLNNKSQDKRIINKDDNKITDNTDLSQNNINQDKKIIRDNNNVINKQNVDNFIENQNIDQLQQKIQGKRKSRQVCLSDPSEVYDSLNKTSGINNLFKNKDYRNASNGQFYGQQSQLNEIENYTSYRQILKDQKNMNQYYQSITNRVNHLEKEETKNQMKVEETRKRIFQIIQEKLNQNQSPKMIFKLKEEQPIVQKLNANWDDNVKVIEKKIRSKSVAEQRSLAFDQKKQIKLKEEKKRERVYQLKNSYKQQIEESQKNQQYEQLMKEQKCQKIKISLQKSREKICKALQDKKQTVIQQLNKSFVLESKKNEMLNISIQQLEEKEQNLLSKLQQTQLKQQNVLFELQDALQMKPEEFCQQYLGQIKNDQEQMLTEQSNKILNLYGRKRNNY